MASESIVPGKTVPALARIRFDPAMNLGVPFEIVLPDKALLAMAALILPIS
jgi:hypothetical protein